MAIRVAVRRRPIQRLTFLPLASQLVDRLKDRWGGNSDRREVTMRLFRSAVLIIMLGVAGCQTASGHQVRLPAIYHGDHGGRHG